MHHAAPNPQVEVVDADRGDLDEHLARAGTRSGQIDELQDRRIAMDGDVREALDSIPSN